MNLNEQRKQWFVCLVNGSIDTEPDYDYEWSGVTDSLFLMKEYVRIWEPYTKETLGVEFIIMQFDDVNLDEISDMYDSFDDNESIIQSITFGNDEQILIPMTDRLIANMSEEIYQFPIHDDETSQLVAGRIIELSLLLIMFLGCSTLKQLLLTLVNNYVPVILMDDFFEINCPNERFLYEMQKQTDWPTPIEHTELIDREIDLIAFAFHILGYEDVI